MLQWRAMRFAYLLLALVSMAPAMAHAQKKNTAKATATGGGGGGGGGKLSRKLGVDQPAHPWLKLDTGLSVVARHALSGGRVPRSDVDTTGVGAVLGAEGAARWERFSLGARGRFHPLSSFNLWQLGAIAGLHFPQETFDVSLSASVGYAAATNADWARSAQGLYAGVGAAFDYPISGPLMIGAGLNADGLFLGRGGSCRNCDIPRNTGIALTAAARFSLLF